MIQDLRFGFRMLLKHKGFTLVAVLSLALGIGANTALFSVMDAVLLKTLPVTEPERLALFEWRAGLTFRTNGMCGTSSVPVPPGTKGLSLFRYDVFEKLRQARAAALQDSPLSDFFAFAPLRELTAMVEQQAEIVDGQAVSGGYFAGLGVHPILGRPITDEDDMPGAPPVVVLSHEFWQERFGASPAVIGRPLKLNKVSFTIIGVTPPAFTGAQQVDYHPVVNMPIACEPLLSGERSRLGTAKEPGFWWINLMGRLKPGATFERASVSLNGTFQAAALEVMPPPRKSTEPVQLKPEDYPRLIAESGTPVRQDPGVLWRIGAPACSNRYFGRVGVFGSSTHKRDWHPHGARRATNKHSAVGPLARDEAGVAGAGRRRFGWLRVAAFIGQPIFREPELAASIRRATLRGSGD